MVIEDVSDFHPATSGKCRKATKGEEKIVYVKLEPIYGKLCETSMFLSVLVVFGY